MLNTKEFWVHMQQIILVTAFENYFAVPFLSKDVWKIFKNNFEIQVMEAHSGASNDYSLD